MAHSNARTALELDFASSIAHAVRDIQHIFARHQAYTKTLRALSVLDDAQLDDLGIARGDIKAIARREAQNI
ncbi:MAG: DUF1127 domain-containing protein [Pelagimonas sp.]|jgi:uncharacterized protein YjiS (DUF1127 family)|nr:DUF1127 domain-containing protein [Pelagimonas sp.]